MSKHDDSIKIDRLASKYPQVESLAKEFPGGWRAYQCYLLEKYCMAKCGKPSDSYHSIAFILELEKRLEEKYGDKSVRDDEA